MATDFGKILDAIEKDNAALKDSRAALNRAFEKLDARINAMGAGVRIEPFAVGKGKDSAVIGFRRYHTGWHISTIVSGLGGTGSEVPAVEAPAALQVEVMAGVGTILEKLSASIADRLKTTKAAVKEADKLLAALS